MKQSFCLLLLMLALVGCHREPSSASDSPDAPATPPATPNSVEAPPVPAVDQTADIIQHAGALRGDGKLAEARDTLQPIAALTNAPDRALSLLGEINMQLLLTPAPSLEKTNYTIVDGDSLKKLARKFSTTVELLKASNNLTRDVIRVGDRMQIYQGNFSVTVSKSTNLLTLLDNGHFFKRYRVGTGQYSKTPVGDFKVTLKIENPPWWRSDGRTIPFGDPDNILGTHWLGLSIPRYGIHGTWETNSIGKQASAGCIRLLNSDVAELYIILPVGTPVSIRD